MDILTVREVNVGLSFGNYGAEALDVPDDGSNPWPTESASIPVQYTGVY